MEQVTREIVRVGVDLAKRVIQVHGVDAAGGVVTSRALSRERFMPWCAQLPRGCLVAMEASSSAHHWCRRLIALGLDARIVAAQLAAPYRQEGRSGKNDANDAAAICEAASRPKMRFVPVKSVEQQSMLCVHKLRVEQHLAWCDQRIAQHHRDDPEVWRAAGVIGIGPITASAVVATVGDFRQFKSGAQFGAWAGLVPRQRSSGGKSVLGGITKHGQTYLRTLLIQAAKSAVLTAHRREDRISRWVLALRERSGWQKATVALANKNARILWALMTRSDRFDADHLSTKPA